MNTWTQNKPCLVLMVIVRRKSGLHATICRTIIAELHARVGGAPLLRKSTHPRKFGNHVTDRPTVRPHHRHTNVYSHTFLVTLGAQDKADCTSMLSSIDSCQNRVSADHYHLTESWAQVSTHRCRVFFEVIR